MWKPVPVLTAFVALFLVPAPAPAAPPPGGDEKELVEKVNKSIDHGVQFLKSAHTANNQWENLTLNLLGEMHGGVTALAVLAMLNCGERPDERTVKAGLDYLRRLPPQKTYVVGLSIMAFAEARQPRDLPKIQQFVDWLVATGIKENGRLMGWGYPFAEQGGGRPDGSNTQYALLGLYAGKQAGAKIDDATWKAIRDLYITTQLQNGPDAGAWKYHPAERASFTMTVAGVSGLVIAGMGLNESQQKLDPATGVAANCGRYDANEPLARGMNWIGQHFSFTGAKESKSVYYNIYGIERIGRLSGQRFIGRLDWYREGCELLVREQDKNNGAWSMDKGSPIDGVRTIATSFALLFLSKGRTPVLLSKLAYGDSIVTNGALIERGDVAGVVGWNRKHNDARHLTEFASKELFNGLPLGWQVYDARRKEFNRPGDILDEVGVLVQTPILYFNGHKKPVLTKQQQEILKKYVEEGGFVLAEACCGSEEFAAGFRDLMRELFPDSKLQPMPPEHPIWRTFFAVPPTAFPKLESLDRGCRTVVVFSPEPLAGYWEESKYMPPKEKKDVSRGELAFRLAGNVIAYATGMEPPKQRLTTRRIVDARKDLSPPKGFVKPAQIRLAGEPPPAPAAMRNLMAHLQSAARLDVVLETESVFPNNEELFKYKFMYMHGRKRFDWSAEDIENVKMNLMTGGVLFADACCGKPEFDAAFRAMVAKMFPDQKLEVIPATDDLYSAKLNGAALTSVRRREKADASGGDGGFKDLPPYLEGIKMDGRWAVIYSKYDVGCALEGHKSTDCLGHDRDSALRIASAAMLYALKR